MKFFRTLLSVLLLFAVSARATAETIRPHEVKEEDDGLSVHQLPSVWETHRGTSINLADLKGNVLVIVMVYTACKAACPLLIGAMKNIEQQIVSKRLENVKYLLVTIDPVNDSPARLKEISEHYGLIGDQWLLLRGTKETTPELANVLAVKYKQISPMDFSHSNIISVFDKSGVLRHQREGLSVDSTETIETITRLAQ